MADAYVVMDATCDSEVTVASSLVSVCLVTDDSTQIYDWLLNGSAIFHITSAKEVIKYICHQEIW